MSFFPNKQLLIFAYVIAIFYLLVEIFLFLFLKQFRGIAWLNGGLAVLVTLILFYRATSEIIFDFDRRQVFEKSCFGKRKIAVFEEISGIVFVNHTFYGDNRMGFYKLAFKTDIFGKGKRLTRIMKKGSPELNELQTVTIPALIAKLNPAHV